MANTSYKSRVLYREHGNNTDWTGEYKLLVRAKSIPSPLGTPNNVESTSLEDDSQTFEKGIKTSDSLEIVGNLEKEYYQEISKLDGKKLDFLFLYGIDGVGGQLKIARQGSATVTPNDVGGVDEILEMTVTVVPSTSAEDVTDQLTVTDNSNGTFTVV